MKILRILVVVLSFCIETNNTLFIHRNVNTTLNRVNTLFRNCSNNQLGIQHVVHPRIIRLPCNPIYMNCRYDVLDRTISSMIDTTGYYSIVYIVPNNLGCMFAGLGIIGCQNNCRAWIIEEYYNKANVYMHELGHNMGLQHAYYKNLEYNDITDTMGFCCLERCFNPVNNQKLGWTRPQRIYNNTNRVVVSRNQYVVANFNRKNYYVKFTGSSPYIPLTFQNQIALYEDVNGRSNFIQSYSIARNTSVVSVANNVATFTIPIF